MPPPNSSLAALDDLDVDELFAQLAIAEAGTEPDLGLALKSISEIRTMMSAEGAMSADSLGGLIRRGKQIFNRYWPAIKDALCKLWNEHGQEWLDKAADVISSILRLPKIVIAIILKISVKLGMDALCDANASPQPA